MDATCSSPYRLSMARVYVMLPYQLLSTRCLKRKLAPSTISINRLALKTRHETRAILKSFNCRLRNRILVSSYLSCGPQRSKNYIHNIPLEQDWYSDVTRPFLSVKGLAPQTNFKPASKVAHIYYFVCQKIHTGSKGYIHRVQSLEI